MIRITSAIQFMSQDGNSVSYLAFREFAKDIRRKWRPERFVKLGAISSRTASYRPISRAEN